MGSFNTTCFVSNQTIAGGDRILLFPIKQQTSYNDVELTYGNTTIKKKSYSCSPCYPIRYWNTCGPYLIGEYDDYGQFILDNTAENVNNIRVIFDMLLRTSACVNEGKNEYHDIPFDFKTVYAQNGQYTFEQLIEIWEYMWKRVDEKRIFIANYQQDLVPFDFAVMHEPVAKYLIEMSEKRKNWKKESCDRFGVVKRHYEKLPKLIIDIQKNGKDKFLSFFAAERIIKMEEFLRDVEGTNNVGYYDIDTDEIIKIIAEGFLIAGKTEITDGIIKNVLVKFNQLFDAYYIMSGLEEMNVTITPMVYARQDYHNEIGKMYAKMVQKVSNEVSKFRKEKYGE